MSTEYKFGITLQANTQQYTAAYTGAGQTHAAFVAQVRSGSAQASSAIQSTTTAAQAMGNGLRAAGQQGAEGLMATASASQAAQSAGAALLAGLRDQIAVSGKSTDELLRYRAAQAGVAAEAAPLILQLQNQRAAQQAAAEGARAEEAAQRANAAAKQQAANAQESFLAGLRDQAALQGKTHTEVMRYRAAQLGVAEGAEQYIRALEQGASAHRVGALSAKEHAMAMRMLPMQMTDVVTSVASGMPVWMVAIQQGGQIKDSFGGVGNALRAVLGAITPTVAGIGLLAGAAGLVAAAYHQGSAEADGYRQAVVMTGNAAGTSVNQLTDMARAMSAISGTQGAAAASLTALAGTGAIASENLQQFATVAMDLERRIGQPIKTTAQHLEELGKAPVEASVKLNEQYHYLTESVYRQIKALQDQGKQDEAASLAQRTYANAMAERTAELRSNLGALERMWEGLGKAAGWAWDRMLNIGRSATLSDVRAKIEETNRQLNDLIAGDGFDSTGGGAATGTGGRGRAAQIERLKKTLGELQAQAAPLEAEESQAQIRAEQRAEEEAKLAARQRIDTLKQNVRTQAEIRRQEIDQLNRDRETLKLSQADYDALVAGINEKYKDKKAAGAAGRISVSDSELASMQAQLEAARQHHQALLTLGASASELNAGERESLKIGQELTRVTDEKTVARLREKQALADALGVQLRSNDGLEKSLKAHQALIDTTSRDADSLDQRARAQEAANAVAGKGRTAIEQMTLAELEHQMAEAQGSDRFSPQYIAALELKIAAQKRWVTALQGADYKAVKQHVDELLRGAQELSKAYADERALSGLTVLEREKIVAQRQVELKYAKELAALDASTVTDAEKQIERERILTAQRTESAVAVARVQEAHMARASDEINRTLTDALMRGFEAGKGFMQNLADTTENIFNSMVLRPVISAIVTPVSLVINGIVQQGLGALGLGGGGGGAGSAMSLLSLGKDLYGAITGGFSAISTEIAYTVQRGLNFLNPSGALGAPGGTAAGIGTAAGYAAGALGGIYGGRMISGGYSAMGNSGNSLVNAGTAIGAIWGPVGSLVGGLIGGAVNRLFGRKLKDSGIEGEFGGETGFEGRLFEYHKGGLFRSSKTKYRDLDEEVRAALADQFSAMRDGAKGMAEVLGLGTSAIDDFTASIKVSLHGLSAEEADKKLKEEFDKIAESLAATTLGTDEYSRAGETALETLSRLSGSLVGVNTVFDQLGYTLLEASLAGADAASRLADRFGGMEGFNSATGAYFQNFYSDDERREAMRRQLAAELGKLDLDLPDIDSRDARRQWRDLVEAQDRNTEAGARNWAMLIQLAPAFAAITDEGTTAADELRSVADALGTITADNVKGLFDDVLKNAGSAEEARTMGAQGFEDMVMGAMLQGLIGNLSSIVMAQIVTPLITTASTQATLQTMGAAVSASTLAAGGALGGAANAAGGTVASQAMAEGGVIAANAMVAGGAAVGQVVSSALDAARAQMAAFGEIMRDPAFQDLISQGADLFGDLSADLFDFRGSLGSLGSSFSSAGGAMAGAASEGAAGMTTIADSIIEEVKRIRGEIASETAAPGFAHAQAQYSIAVAQARAGDQEAAQSLPGLSRAMLDAARGVMTSAADYRFFAATTAATLSDIAASRSGSGSAQREQERIDADRQRFLRQGDQSAWLIAWMAAGEPGHWEWDGDKLTVPAFANGGMHTGGWAMVGERGPELAYMPPSRIYTADQTRSMQAALGMQSTGGGQGDQLVAVIDVLERRLAALQDELREIKGNTRRMDDVIDEFARRGMPVVNQPGTALETA